MADWVENLLVVRGTNEELTEWNTGLGGRGTGIAKFSFEKLMPIPENESDWYSWCIKNWGTKWDTAPYGTAERTDDGFIYAFMTPWDPPINLMIKMTKYFAGLEFELRYHYQCTGEGGLYYNGAKRSAADLALNEQVLPNLFRDLITDPFKKFEKPFSMFG